MSDREYNRIVKALKKYMEEVLGIYPDLEDIEWYGDIDTDTHFIWRFDYMNKRYKIAYNKEERKVESSEWFI